MAKLWQENLEPILDKYGFSIAIILGVVLGLIFNPLPISNLSHYEIFGAAFTTLMSLGVLVVAVAIQLSLHEKSYFGVVGYLLMGCFFFFLFIYPFLSILSESRVEKVWNDQSPHVTRLDPTGEIRAMENLDDQRYWLAVNSQASQIREMLMIFFPPPSDVRPSYSQ